MRALAKYLSDHAEPETAAAGSITSRYARAFVVPAFREHASLLDGYVAAARAAPGATLGILVVNGPDDAPEAEHLENGRFFSSVLEKLERAPKAGSRSPNVHLGTVVPSKLDVLVIDRASPGLRVPRKEGVGLARKIGADVALALHAQAKVASRLLFFTDADTTLPEDHFLQSKLEGARDPSAVVFPFWHEPSGDAAVDEATALYELSLRYYVRGLRFAGSPYAFHTLGSATAVFAESYAAVRGVPKRSAAEDFYLLSKLAKVGPVAQAASSPVLIRSRRSDRTPFGTGASVDGFLAAERAFYDPRCFVALRETLGVVTMFAEHGSVSRLEMDLAGIDSLAGPVVRRVFDELRIRPAFERMAMEVKEPAGRLLRAHAWFDAFRTLKLVHALRDELWPSVPWRHAVVEAPFAPAGTEGDSHDLAELRSAWAKLDDGAR